MNIDNDELEQAAIINARYDLYAFSRYIFYKRKGFKWQRAAHHKIICDALMRVYRGECKRLIINLPPRYSKTQLMMDFAAWTLGHAPDSEFIHASYSATLAVSNSATIRDTIQNESYRAIFPDVELSSDSKAYWKTKAGGVMYATGSGGTITGFGAGKHRAGFGGCFPVGTRVWTESGLIPIDRIVKERMQIKVWAFDYVGEMVLRPVVAWHTNPPNEIWRVTFDDGTAVECTQDHKFWTSRGWVRADSLSVDDHLPRVNGSMQSFNNVSVDSKSIGGWLDPSPVLSSCSAGSVGDSKVSLPFGEDGSEISLFAATSGYGLPSSNGLPCISAPYLVDNTDVNAMPRSKTAGRYADSVVDGQCLIVGEYSDGMNFGFAEGAVSLTVEDVCSARIIAQIDKHVVGWIPVKMTDISPIGSISNKCQHNQRMNECIRDFRISGQADAEMSARLSAQFKHLPTVCIDYSAQRICDNPVFTSDASVVTGGVIPFVSGYRKPVFFERVRHDDVTFCLTVDDYHNFTIESGLVVKNCILLDDLHKADEARSDTMRNGVIEWFQNTLESRTNSPDTPIILIMQRLHELDIAGWLLAGGNGEAWEHVCIPAINSDDTALWPEKHSIEDLHRMREANPYVFAGQYMQQPSPDGGGLFKADNIGTVDAIPHGFVTWARGWDFASTTTGDYTAGVRIGKLPDGRFIISDVVRLRVAPEERDDAILKTTQRDGQMVKQSLPQDPGQAGKTQILYLTKQLAGFNVVSSPESGDKVTRAEPFAAQCNVGNVVMLRGAWNDDFIKELRSFPNGANDDQVDGASRGFGELIGNNLSVWASLAG